MEYKLNIGDRIHHKMLGGGFKYSTVIKITDIHFLVKYDNGKEGEYDINVIIPGGYLEYTILKESNKN